MFQFCQTTSISWLPCKLFSFLLLSSFKFVGLSSLILFSDEFLPYISSEIFVQVLFHPIIALTAIWRIWGNVSFSGRAITDARGMGRTLLCHQGGVCRLLKLIKMGQRRDCMLADQICRDVKGGGRSQNPRNQWQSTKWASWKVWGRFRGCIVLWVIQVREVSVSQVTVVAKEGSVVFMGSEKCVNTDCSLAIEFRLHLSAGNKAHRCWGFCALAHFSRSLGLPKSTWKAPHPTNHPICEGNGNGSRYGGCARFQGLPHDRRRNHKYRSGTET